MGRLIQFFMDWNTIPVLIFWFWFIFWTGIAFGAGFNSTGRR